MIACSRAGLGKSQARPEARTPAQLGKEFDALIAAARLTPPFILMGHSYGAYLIRQFAARRPEQVAGFVFVDPGIERFDTELAKRDAATMAQDVVQLEQMTPLIFRAENKIVNARRDSRRWPRRSFRRPSRWGRQVA